ncbi:MAG: RecQ family ATP-dependent DNA helicase [Phycisphaeraceae bacterium]|nr:RecQ family ATP-dependent DNA helicase [Phycisphaeraceae bacterium]
MSFPAARALELLRAGTGNPSAIFRDGQASAIQHVVEGEERLLLVQRTGWGKSYVYFIATKLLREAGNGPALLISPLVSLMRNQMNAAARMGVRAESIHHENTGEWDAVESRVLDGQTDILLISPERLGNDRFRDGLLAEIADRISLLVIDEAHCISDWGHDFRPDYRRIGRILRTLPPNLRVLATTATANDRVLEDLREQLGPRLKVERGPLHRPSLCLQTIRLPDQAERLAWLAKVLPTLDGSGIVYTLTIRDAQRVADWLGQQGIESAAYTRKSEDRPALEDALLGNEVKALVATTALGMGFDKPDLAFVIHYQTPGSVIAYYQQVGRAGRGLSSAYGVLLGGTEDTDVTSYFIDTAFPTRDEVGQIIGALDSHPDGLSVPDIESLLNIGHGTIEKALQLLSLESPAPVVKEKSRWTRTMSTLDNAFWERADRLTNLRREEQQQMQSYLGLESGHMEFLIRALDGDARGLVKPDTPALPTTVDPALVQQAIGFLRRSAIPIEPRKKWPSGGLENYGIKGRIDPQNEFGRSLCVWGDAGWGRLVRDGKYHDGRFADDLVEACATMVHEWSPHPAPQWLACVPSRRHPELVPNFAARLAARLSLPYMVVLGRTQDRPEQKTMRNSFQQARNVDGAMEVCGRILSGPVLLIDDVVDSRWTLTVAGWLLRSNGAGPVFPLVLADSSRS